MNIFICCSKAFYSKVSAIRDLLESEGHTITLPNSFDNPGREDEMREMGADEHSRWKASMIRLQREKVACNDAILVLNFEKNGLANYIGGATFLEMFVAFELEKTIFLYNDIPIGMLRDEILGFEPVLIAQDLSLVVEANIKPTLEHLNLIQLEEAMLLLNGHEKFGGSELLDPPLTLGQLAHAKSCPECQEGVKQYECLMPPAVLRDWDSTPSILDQPSE